MENKINICPCCKQDKIHKCMIVNFNDIEHSEILYNCPICNNSWSSIDLEKEEIPKYDCYWCENYKSALKGEDINQSSFVLLINPGGTGLSQGIDPIYCPICGKLMSKEE